jgi:hypothetical protein
MKLDQSTSPIYRKIIVQWYDSEIMCLAAIVFLLPVVLFGLVGINVAKSTQQYHVFLWIPTLLTILSFGVIFSMTVRLIRRFLF